MNKELVDYYKGLIELREKYDAFRRADYDDVIFFNVTDNEFALGYYLTYKEQNFIVMFNANPEKAEENGKF